MARAAGGAETLARAEQGAGGAQSGQQRGLRGGVAGPITRARRHTAETAETGEGAERPGARGAGGAGLARPESRARVGGPGEWSPDRGGEQGGGPVEGAEPRPGGHHCHGRDLGVKMETIQNNYHTVFYIQYLGSNNTSNLFSFNTRLIKIVRSFQCSVFMFSIHPQPLTDPRPWC